MSDWIHDIGDEALYRELWRVLQGGDLVLFAGSGLTAQACTDDGRRPPLWSGLLRRMSEWCEHNQLLTREPSLDELEDLIDQGYLTEAGQELEDVLGQSSRLQECLREVLLTHEAKLATAHRLIAQIPFRGYLTTNYDDLIENACFEMESVSIATYYERTADAALDAYLRKQRFVWKLHGNLIDPASIVLGNRSYARLMHNDSTYRTCLETMFRVSSALFVGFRGNDPDIDAITTRVAMFSSTNKRHWMVLPKDEVPTLKAKRLQLDKGIHVIGYDHDSDGHTGLEDFLRRLASGASVPVAPPEDSTKNRSFESRRKSTPRPDEAAAVATAPPTDARPAGRSLLFL